MNNKERLKELIKKNPTYKKLIENNKKIHEETIKITNAMKDSPMGEFFEMQHLMNAKPDEFNPEGDFSGTLWLAVTAEFPEEDTGYIEDGFEFCLTPGANLLSFPCDSPISVGESLPQGVENFITEIVGQGVAASYNPALGWIGNLAEFTPGSGYWFKSNKSLCFEYDCVED